MVPKIKIAAISNVYCRMMMFEKQGDIEEGHYHTFDHGTLVAKGSLRVEILSDDNQVISSKIFDAPSFIFVQKDKKHRLVSLQDDTLACCIHALRDVDEDIIPSDTLISEKVFQHFGNGFDPNQPDIPTFFEKEKDIKIKLFTK